MLYLAAAYAVIWAVVFIFVILMVRRQRQLETELQSLEELVNGRQDNAGG